MKHNPVEIIRKKRDGEKLSQDELAEFIGGIARGAVPDYQASAFLMAVYFRGMEADETAELTRQMLQSGTQLAWDDDGRPVVDKHSTGGVGDKISLLLAPMLAVCGVRVPMISGRGLGATGGTLDKLEAIPGYRAELSEQEFRNVCNRVGCVIAGATSTIAPADKKLYALRDVTATVPSIPLITGSIMSKKLAAGLEALVLDVKWGTGAFMKKLDDARRLARSLVDVGTAMGVKTIALLTDMNQPLGRMVGHAVEIDETVAGLQGKGPTDVTELTIALGSELLVAVGIEKSLEDARVRLQKTIDSGEALDKLREMISAQGGDLDAPRPVAPATEITAARKGYVTAIDCEALGLAISDLGGARRQVGDKLDMSVGIEMLARLGDAVEQRQPLVRLFAHEKGVEAARRRIVQAIEIDDLATVKTDLIVERVTA
jgi:pyrimidine-nucleoside phosphorylase